MTTRSRFGWLSKVRWQVWGFMALGIIVGLVSIYFQHANTQQTECFRNNIVSLVDNLQDRSDYATRDAKATRLEGRATRLESRANNTFYKQAFAAKGLPDVLAAYGKYRVTMADVNDMRAKVDNRRTLIAKDRAENPIPAFPEGTCD